MLITPFFAVCATFVLAGDTPSIVIERDETSAPFQLDQLRRSPAPSRPVEPSVRMRQGEVLAKLKSRSAIEQARQLMTEGKYAEAIAELEPCLDDPSSAADLLPLLETAYRGEIATLVGQGHSQQAALVAERLRVLVGDVRSAASFVQEPVESTTADERPVGRMANLGRQMVDSVDSVGRQMVDSVKSIVPRAKQAMGVDSTPAPIEARGKIEDTVALVPEPSKRAGLLEQATDLFQQKEYPKALVIYEKAYQDDPEKIQPHRVRWGYCLLYVTIDRYNALLEEEIGSVSPEIWQQLRADAEVAGRLAPRIQEVAGVIQSIDDRILESQQHQLQAGPSTLAATSAESTLSYGATLANTEPERAPFRHLPASNAQWQMTESQNFVIHHHDRRLAEDVVALAESARQSASELWFGGEPLHDWQPKCHLYLYPTGQAYGMATNVPAESPGHSKVFNQSGTIQGREIHLRVDDPNMRHAVLPHEVAHVVFAGRFGAHSLPRWADEGMAVLTEPIDKQDAHLANLSRTQMNGRGFSCGQIMSMGQYPGGDRMRDFYAHSVGVCRYLVERHGHDRLVAFLRQSLDTGNYEASLQQVFGISSFQHLEQEFRGYVASLGRPTMQTAIR